MSCQDLKLKVLYAWEDLKHASFLIVKVGPDFAYPICYSHSKDQQVPDFATFTAIKLKIETAERWTGLESLHL